MVKHNNLPIDNKVGGPGTRYLAKALAENNTLTSLDLSGTSDFGSGQTTANYGSPSQKIW